MDTSETGLEKITVNANAVSMPRSRFALTIDNASSAGDDSFITFVDHNKVEIVNEEEEELRRWIIRSRHAELFDENGDYTPSARFSMGLNMDVTPDVDFRLTRSFIRKKRTQFGRTQFSRPGL